MALRIKNVINHKLRYIYWSIAFILTFLAVTDYIFYPKTESIIETIASCVIIMFISFIFYLVIYIILWIIKNDFSVLSRKDKHFYLLSFEGENGVHTPEYIPKRISDLESWLSEKKIKYLLNHKKEIYYGDIRFIFSEPTLKKIEDIAFVMHVLDVHDGVPEDKREFKDYNKIYNLYKNEIQNLLISYSMSKKEKLAVLHPYGKAYIKKWITKKPDPKIGLVYHGINWEEYTDFLYAISDKYTKMSKNESSLRSYHNKKLKNKVLP